MSYALLFLVFLRVANVPIGLHAFLLAFQRLQMEADRQLAIMTPGLALGEVFFPREIIREL